jgi:hypothetical protein
MKVGTEVMIKGLPNRGKAGIFTGKVRMGLLRIRTRYEVTLPNGEVLYTYQVQQIHRKKRK